MASVIEAIGQAVRHPEYWKKKHTKLSYAALLLNKSGYVATTWEVKYVTVMLTYHSKLKGHLHNLKFQIILPRVLEVVIQWRYIYPLSYGVPVWERYGSTLLPATREQHDQNCTQSH